MSVCCKQNRQHFADTIYCVMIVVLHFSVNQLHPGGEIMNYCRFNLVRNLFNLSDIFLIAFITFVTLPSFNNISPSSIFHFSFVHQAMVHNFTPNTLFHSVIQSQKLYSHTLVMLHCVSGFLKSITVSCPPLTTVLCLQFVLSLY